MTASSSVGDTVRQAEVAAFRYFELTNTAIGLLSFNAALACISTENPRLYAFIAAVFVLFVWSEGRRSLDARLRLLRNIDHPALKFVNIWRQSTVALLGWAFLGAVATGWFGTKGLLL